MIGLIRDKRVLVTGGAGVIGRELLKLLVNEGANVLSVDRSPIPGEGWGSVLHVQKDLVTDTLCELRDFQPQVIFHLAAAFERSTECSDFWSTNWNDNVLLSHRIVDLTKELRNLEVFVFASSYLLYSPSLYLSTVFRDEAVFLREADLVVPRNLCGAAKYYTEREISMAKKLFNPSLRTANVRIFRVYGCGSRDVISRWTRAALLGQDIEVYNKQNRFDFIFSRDAAEGLLRLGKSPDAEGEINLGSGIARGIEEVLNTLAECIPRVKYKIRDFGVTESLESSCADLTRLRLVTGWTPSTGLEKGLRMIVEYEQGRLGHGSEQ